MFEGIDIRRHDTPNFIKQFQYELLYTLFDCKNSEEIFSRVIPVELNKGESYNHDKEKYREMLLEVAETVLGYFGFDRNVYGDHISKKNKKWWRPLLEERQRDIDIERT